MTSDAKKSVNGRTKLRVAVMISGRGSNLQCLIDACAADNFPATIVRVISNVADVYGLKRAEQAGIATSVISHKDFDDRDSFETVVHDTLKADRCELICLAGFMRILTDGFVSRWRDRLVNIHPSLLPAFKGLHIHERAIEAGVRFSGCTVHFVRPAMDDGPIIAQAAVPVQMDDTPEDLAARVLKVEHTIYPLALRLIADRRVRVVAERVVIQGELPLPASVLNPPVYSKEPSA